MEREADRSVGWGSCLVVSMQELDVDVLIEGAGHAVTRDWEHAPAASSGIGRARRVRDSVLFRRIAESEERQKLQSSVQKNRAEGAPVRVAAQEG